MKLMKIEDSIFFNEFNTQHIYCYRLLRNFLFLTIIKICKLNGTEFVLNLTYVVVIEIFVIYL